MNVLFVSKERPGRFGPLARELAKVPGWRCEFLCEDIGEPLEGVSLIHWTKENSPPRGAHFITQDFDRQVRDAETIYEAARSSCRQTPDIVFDVSGSAATLPLRDLFRCPVVTYFEYFHQTAKDASQASLRQQLSEMERLRLRAINAAHLLDLVNCDAGVTSTQFQHALIPKEFGYKVRVHFEGCDLDTFSRRNDIPRVIGRRKIPATTRIVTYLANRLSPSNGFETFMESAKEIARRHPEVLFVVCGLDTNAPAIEGQPRETVKQRFLRERKAEASKFVFVDRLPDQHLGRLFSITDLLIHLTVPVAVSPSLIGALACECVVLASDTTPVREFIRHRQNGLLANFFNASALADEAVHVLKSPANYRTLGTQARAFVEQHLSLKRAVPNFQRLLLEAGDRLPDQFAEEIVTIEMEEEGAS